jgi:hypothetical protein
MDEVKKWLDSKSEFFPIARNGGLCDTPDPCTPRAQSNGRTEISDCYTFIAFNF